VDFSTYLLKSGSRHGGHGGQTGLGFGQPHGAGLLHVLHAGGGGGVQEGSLEEKSPLNPSVAARPWDWDLEDPNPSFFFINAVLRIIPIRTPNSRSNPGTTIFSSLAIGGPLYPFLLN
jgi:hypothetical protein